MYDTGLKAVKAGKDRPFSFLGQRAKKVMAESLELVDFAIGLVNAVLNLLDKRVKFFAEFKLQKNKNYCNHSYASQKIFGLVLAIYNLPKVQAVSEN